MELLSLAIKPVYYLQELELHGRVGRLLVEVAEGAVNGVLDTLALIPIHF